MYVHTYMHVHTYFDRKCAYLLFLIYIIDLIYIIENNNECSSKTKVNAVKYNVKKFRYCVGKCHKILRAI